MDVGFVDGFDHYAPSLASGAAAGLNTTWLFTAAIDGDDFKYVTGLNGFGRALWMNSALFNISLIRAFASTKKISLAFAMKFDFINVTNSQELFSFRTSDNGHQLGIGTTSIGKLALFGDNSAIIATSDVGINAGIIYRCVLTVDITDPTVVPVNFYLTGEEESGITGVYDLSASVPVDSDFGALMFSSPGHGVNANPYSKVAFDDLFLAINECTNLGETELYLINPDGDVQKQWTPLTGTDNFEMVNDTSTDGDSTYNSSDTVGQIDKFSYPDLTREPEYIHGVSVVTCAAKEESATRTIRNLLTSGGVDYPGADVNQSQSYTWFMDHYLTNPNGDVPWDVAAINALITGYENRV